MSYQDRIQSFACCETGVPTSRSRVDPGKLLALIHRIKSASNPALHAPNSSHPRPAQIAKAS